MTNEISPTEAIIDQLKLIENTNKIIESSGEPIDSLMVRQYTHLKKELTKNLFKMLEEYYKIKIPVLKGAA